MDSAIRIVENPVCGGFAEVLPVITDQAYPQQLVEGMAACQGVVNDFCQKQTVDQGEISAIVVTVAAAVINDEIITFPDGAGDAV